MAFLIAGKRVLEPVTPPQRNRRTVVETQNARHIMQCTGRHAALELKADNEEWPRASRLTAPTQAVLASRLASNRPNPSRLGNRKRVRQDSREFTLESEREQPIAERSHPASRHDRSKPNRNFRTSFRTFDQGGRTTVSQGGSTEQDPQRRAHRISQPYSPVQTE